MEAFVIVPGGPTRSNLKNGAGKRDQRIAQKKQSVSQRPHSDHYSEHDLPYKLTNLLSLVPLSRGL
jgi:hypothetical protein